MERVQEIRTGAQSVGDRQKGTVDGVTVLRKTVLAGNNRKHSFFKRDFTFILFETGSHVAQASLKLTM